MLPSPSTQPRRVYAPGERLRLVSEALDMHARKIPIPEIATHLGVTFGTIASWIYHPQHNRLRAEAIAARDQPQEKPSAAKCLARALHAYTEDGRSFDEAVRMGGCTVEALKQALRTLPRKPTHKVYR